MLISLSVFCEALYLIALAYALWVGKGRGLTDSALLSEVKEVVAIARVCPDIIGYDGLVLFGVLK